MKLIKKISLSLIVMTGLGTYAQEFEANLQLRPRFEMLMMRLLLYPSVPV